VWPRLFDLAGRGWALARAFLFAVPREVDVTLFWIRVATLALCALWSVSIATESVTTGSIMGSWVHWPELFIHEAGHIVFRIFGTYAGVLGGSLFQVVLPLAGSLSMLLRRRAPFPAAICVWFAGVGFVDFAPYVYDAQNPKLPLIGGGTGRDSFHDWRFLLDRFDWVRFSKPFGFFTYWTGLFVMLLGLVWAGIILFLQSKNRAGDLYREQ
jgi:hypothetical protein